MYAFEVASLVICLIILLGLTNSDFKPGDICTIEDGIGKIRVIKVLVVEPGLIHLLIYKNKFAQRPKEINTNDLSLGRDEDPEGFGMKHIPLDINGFKNWKPFKLMNKGLIDEELEGYIRWKENLLLK